MELLLAIAVLCGLLAAFTRRAKARHGRLLAHIEVVTLRDVVASQLGNVRNVTVFLPPGYHDRPERSYPALYINDGQESEALGLRATLARLTVAGRICPLIVIAIPTNDSRLHEYGTAIAPSSRSLGALAAAYSHFVVAELMPLIDTKFRTRSRASFLGMSLGGLSAFDIVWNHPDLFDSVGVMSGSLWWHAAGDETRIEPGQRIAHAQVRRGTHRPLLRFWFQAGTRDEVCDRDGNGIIDAIQDTLELIDELRAVGYSPDEVSYLNVVGGRHDYATWARALPDFLTWAFSPGQDRHTEKP